MQAIADAGLGPFNQILGRWFFWFQIFLVHLIHARGYLLDALGSVSPPA
jgi:hypothetical protein